MLNFLVFKEKLKVFYAKNNIFIDPLFKFLFAFISFYLINRNISYSAILKNPLISLILSLISAILPLGSLSIIMFVYVLINIISISVEMAVIFTAFVFVIGVLYYGFKPGNSYLLIIIPILFTLKVPHVIPFVVGLSMDLTAIIPTMSGILIYYTLAYVKSNAGVFTTGGGIDAAGKYLKIINAILTNKLMLLMMLTFMVTIIVVYIVRRLSINYSWQIAIVAGFVSLFISIFIGELILNVSTSLPGLLAGSFISMIVAYIYTLFAFNLDYTRTEYTQFEDDEYYYYVKSVPKISVKIPDVKVEKIHKRKITNKDKK